MPTLAYEPESPMPRTFSAVSVPSASQPAQYSRRIGWRLAWMRKLSSREQRALHRALQQPGGQRGLPLVAHVLLATERAAVRHQLDRDCVGAHAEQRGDLVAVVPHALAARVHVQAAPSSAAGTASVLSGSRNACSMRCVWNTSCTTCALAASAASTSPRAYALTDSTLFFGAEHRDLGVVDGGDRVGDGPQHLVLHVHQLRRLTGVLLGVGHHDRQHVAGVAGALPLADEHRPVLVDDADVLLARDVGGGEHGDHTRRGLRRSVVSMRRMSARTWAVRCSAACSMPGTRMSST